MSNNNQIKILLGVPPSAHVSLAMDEMAALQQQGHTCSTVPYGRNNQGGGAIGKLLSTVAKGWVVIKNLYRTKPHILYLNSRFERVGSTRDFITLLMMKLLYYRKVAIVIKSHGSQADSMHLANGLFKKTILAFLIRNVDGWIFLSNDEKNILSQNFPLMVGKLFVAPNIIDPSRCIKQNNFNEQYQLPPLKNKILYVGRMVKEKGVFDIVDAILKVEDKENCVFVFVGNGPHLEDLKKMAKQNGADKYCRFMGYIPDSECDHFYANCDMMLFPTFDTEGFAMALFKSVATGLPIVTTAVRAAKDYLKEPDNVLWVTKQSPDSIAMAVNRLLLDNKLLQTMQKNNVELGKQFAADAVGKTISEIFKMVILKRRKR